MQVTSWNVNSVRARLDRVLAWLDDHEPDVLCLQELKCGDGELPRAAFEARGYHVAAFGQKTYNGVAILSRTPLADVQIDLPWPGDPQARGIVATVGGLRILDVYVVNGQDVGSDKYAYKLEWLRHLHALVEGMDRATLVLCGDFNIAPTDDDVYDPAEWRGRILCSEPERAAFAGLAALGLTDALRAVRPTGRAFTWWDYRGNGFDQDKGLRIDHFLVGDAVRRRLVDVSIDREERGRPQASDHAPVTLHLRDV